MEIKLMSQLSKSFALILLLNLGALSVAVAQEPTHGHSALQLFDAQGRANTPAWVMNWIYFMLLSFVASLFFVKKQVIARWVAGCFIAGIAALLIAENVFASAPFSGLIASFHLVFWSPALYMLLKHKPFLAGRTAFSIWSGVMTFVILFSFFFDIRDAFLYWQHVLAS